MDKIGIKRLLQDNIARIKSLPAGKERRECVADILDTQRPVIEAVSEEGLMIDPWAETRAKIEPVIWALRMYEEARIPDSIELDDLLQEIYAITDDI